MTCPACHDAEIRREITYYDANERTATVTEYCPRCGYEPTVSELASANNHNQPTTKGETK